MEKLPASNDFDNAITNFLGNIESLRHISPTLEAILDFSKIKKQSGASKISKRRM